MSGDSYTGALVAAGATVHECRWFGSYQGHWIADVTLPDGRRGIIVGYYGSCSGCDAFEAEFGFERHEWDHKEVVVGCDECAAYQKRLADFGRGYFDNLKTPEEAAQEFLPEGRYWSSYGEDVQQAQFILARCTDPVVASFLKAAIDKAQADT